MAGRDNIIGITIPYGLDSPEFEFLCA